MSKLSTEAVIALIALLIAMPPIIFAYLQWRKPIQPQEAEELPLYTTDRPPTESVDIPNHAAVPDQFNIFITRAEGSWLSNTNLVEGVSRLMSSAS
ncbi:hypothetical protein CKAH01_12116 [Colletotrichum kahawae]|uniref:Uncharacterized protein n=1 Tax=Colletotrichum kahawae TaxID=34407 RepID=A0AAE0DCY0_COLKA|nr:hypothetical protein CKAH01_12116 [Colletotrichum kahawae]